MFLEFFCSKGKVRTFFFFGCTVILYGTLAIFTLYSCTCDHCNWSRDCFPNQGMANDINLKGSCHFSLYNRDYIACVWADISTVDCKSEAISPTAIHAQLGGAWQHLLTHLELR